MRSELIFLGVFSGLISSLLIDNSQYLGNGFSDELYGHYYLKMKLTLIRANLTWGAAETLLTLNWANSFYETDETLLRSYSELG